VLHKLETPQTNKAPIMSQSATPAKLKTGGWGARVKGPAKPGDALTITSAGGKSWDATVVRVVWTDGQVSLCATASSDRPSSTGRCKGCGHAIRDAAHHQAMEGYCGECAFDEFDM
jgi:hypothetical protein